MLWFLSARGAGPRGCGSRAGPGLTWTQEINTEDIEETGDDQYLCRVTHVWCTDCTALCTCTTESSRATVSQLRGAAQTGAVRRSVSCSDWSAVACRTCSHQALHQHSTVLGRECSERENRRRLRVLMFVMIMTAWLSAARTGNLSIWVTGSGGGRQLQGILHREYHTHTTPSADTSGGTQ